MKRIISLVALLIAAQLNATPVYQAYLKAIDNYIKMEGAAESEEKLKDAYARLMDPASGSVKTERSVAKKRLSDRLASARTITGRYRTPAQVADIVERVVSPMRRRIDELERQAKMLDEQREALEKKIVELVSLEAQIADKNTREEIKETVKELEEQKEQVEKLAERGATGPEVTKSEKDTKRIDEKATKVEKEVRRELAKERTELEKLVIIVDAAKQLVNKAQITKQDADIFKVVNDIIRDHVRLFSDKLQTRINDITAEFNDKYKARFGDQAINEDAATNKDIAGKASSEQQVINHIKTAYNLTTLTFIERPEIKKAFEQVINTFDIVVKVNTELSEIEGEHAATVARYPAVIKELEAGKGYIWSSEDYKKYKSLKDDYANALKNLYDAKTLADANTAIKNAREAQVLFANHLAQIEKTRLAEAAKVLPPPLEIPEGQPTAPEKETIPTPPPAPAVKISFANKGEWQSAINEALDAAQWDKARILVVEYRKSKQYSPQDADYVNAAINAAEDGLRGIKRPKELIAGLYKKAIDQAFVKKDQSEIRDLLARFKDDKIVIKEIGKTEQEKYFEAMLDKLNELESGKPATAPGKDYSKMTTEQLGNEITDLVGNLTISPTEAAKKDLQAVVDVYKTRTDKDPNWLDAAASFGIKIN